jgi:hypothetical protein
MGYNDLNSFAPKEVSVPRRLGRAWGRPQCSDAQGEASHKSASTVETNDPRLIRTSEREHERRRLRSVAKAQTKAMIWNCQKDSKLREVSLAARLDHGTGTSELRTPPSNLVIESLRDLTFLRELLRELY